MIKMWVWGVLDAADKGVYYNLDTKGMPFFYSRSAACLEADKRTALGYKSLVKKLSLDIQEYKEFND